MASPDLTAIVVTHRSAAHVGACLQALPAAAGALEVDLIVVDNASGDEAPELVRRAYPSARLIANETNRGLRPR